MNTRTILIVGVAAAALLATGLAVTRMGDGGSASAKSAGPLFPELAARLNDAAKVTITGKDAAFVLGKSGASWGATEKGGYPVQFDRVKQLVVGVSQLETVAKMTSNPAQHGKLELADPTAEEGGAKRVTIEDASGKVLADVLIGKPKQHQGFGGKGALYVRKPGDDQTWEVTGQVTVSADASSWLDREVSKLESARVQRVTVHHPDGEILAVSKSSKDDANFKIENLPEGAQLQWDGVANGLATPLQYMSLDDVQRNEGFDTTGATSTEFACFDGLVVTAKTVDKDGKTWLTLSAGVDESLRAAEPVGPPAPQATDATTDATTEGEETEGETAEDEKPEDSKPALKPLEDVKKEADELNAKWGPWVYSIPGYNAANLRKKMTDLLKKEEAPSDPASLLGTEGEAGDATTDDGATIQDATTGEETKDTDDETSKTPTETPPQAPPGDGR